MMVHKAASYIAPSERAARAANRAIRACPRLAALKGPAAKMAFCRAPQAKLSAKRKFPKRSDAGS